MAKDNEKSSLRARAESMLVVKPRIDDNLTLEKAKMLLHELEVHQIELEMQNEELRDTQKRLNNIRDEYTDLFDFAPIGYLLLNKKGIIKNINLTACEMFGVERSFIVDKPLSAYMSSGESINLFFHLQSAFKNDFLTPFEISLKHKTRGEFIARIEGTVNIDKDSEGPICRIAMQDITLKKQAEVLEQQHKELQKEKEKIQQYFDLAPVIFMLIDKNHNIQMINQHGSNTCGFTREELLGRPFFGDIILEDASILSRPYFESNTICRNGQILQIAWRNVVIKDDKGQNFGILLSGEDITQRKLFELKQQKYTEELKERVAARTKELREALHKEKLINEMKNEFVSMASHEFRTPLTGIKSSAVLIKKYNELGNHEKVDKHIERIEMSVNQLTNILEDFLSLDKLERSLFTINKESFDVKYFIEDTIEAALHGIQAKNQKILYTHEGNQKVTLDKKMLSNVIFNVLSNAIRYSKTDVKLNTRVDDAFITITIEDFGIGIPVEGQNYIFEKFFRAKNVTNIQGTGLGLSIVKYYVELMGGEVTFVSEIDKGSTFTLVLPISNL